MSEKMYKVSAPVGSIIVPKELMTEKELRAFAPQIVADPEVAETWAEKAQKDEIDEVVYWLKQSGYSVEIV